MPQVVEHLPSKLKAPSSNLVILIIIIINKIEEEPKGEKGSRQQTLSQCWYLTALCTWYRPPKDMLVVDPKLHLHHTEQRKEEELRAPASPSLSPVPSRRQGQGRYGQGTSHWVEFILH
jgi:hypothetical protein